MTTLTCRDGAELLIGYFEDVLAPDTRAAVDAHLSVCPRCVAFVQAYRAASRIVRDSTDFELPARLADSLQRFLQNRRRLE